MQRQWVRMTLGVIKQEPKIDRQTDRNTHTHLFHLGQLPACVFIISKVLLVAHKNDRDIGTKVFHFRRPFLWNVLYKNKNEERNKQLQLQLNKFPLQGQMGEALLFPM